MSFMTKLTRLGRIIRLVLTTADRNPTDGVLFPYLRAYEAAAGTSTQSSNTGIRISKLLWSGSEPVTWTAVAWNSVSWNAVAWNAVAWNAVAWNNVYWGP